MEEVNLHSIHLPLLFGFPLSAGVQGSSWEIYIIAPMNSVENEDKHDCLFKIDSIPYDDFHACFFCRVYNPVDYENLRVSPEIKEVFQFITK